MSMTPPPGWYPDPSAPPMERWWDGSAWTEHRRAPRPPEPSTVPMGGFGPPTPVPAAVRPAGGGRGKTVALVATAVVVVAAVIASVVVLGDGDDTEAGPNTSSSPAAHDSASGDTSEPPSDEPTASPSDDPSVVTDDLSGITLPVVDGWKKAQYVVDDTIQLTTPDTYDCPGEGTLCHHGTVASSPVTSTNETDPKAIAEADIAEAANHAFDKNEVDEQPYDGITSHRQVKAGTVAVAGRSGYLVRWRVKTGAGPGGYVESLAFRSSTGSEALICVRFAFDAGSDGPPLSDMDKITKGIQPIGGTSSGGVGSSVGPG